MSLIVTLKKRRANERDCSADNSPLEFLSGTDDGVSELIAALLLTSIVTLGIAIIAITFLSNPSPSEIPSLSVDLAKREANVVLIHNGGDPLYRQTTRIMVDGVDRTDDFKTPEGDDWSTFSTGDRLYGSIPRTPDTQVLIIYTGSESPSVIQVIGKQQFTPFPVASFTIDPASGYISQLFSFTDLSSNNPTSWFWDFGDFTNSTERYPTHKYSSAGVYKIRLTSCNEGGCNSTTRNVTVFDFSDFITNESVFVYGTKLDFEGNTIVGEGSTIIIMGDLLSSDLNADSKIYVSNVYINGSVDLSGSQYLGSTTLPELIYIAGDLEMTGASRLYSNDTFIDGLVYLDTNIYGNLYTNGSLDFNNGHIYGETHVNGDLTLTGGDVHDDIYVDGDLTLGWIPSIDSGAYIYYTGSIHTPGWYPQNILDKCIKVGSVPGFSMPAFLDIPIPSAKSDDWYSSHGYVSGGDIMEGIKIYSLSDYSITQQWYHTSRNGTNIVIVSKEGDITFNNFWRVPVTGVIFAPNGRVTFSGDIFEGVVISRDGFYVPSGSSDVIFKNIEEYISDPEDYPF